MPSLSQGIKGLIDSLTGLGATRVERGAGLTDLTGASYALVSNGAQDIVSADRKSVV